MGVLSLIKKIAVYKQSKLVSLHCSSCGDIIDTSLQSFTTMLIHNKDDIQFVTEFPCFLGHPVFGGFSWLETELVDLRYLIRIMLNIETNSH